jgi:hypothetical protein
MAKRASWPSLCLLTARRWPPEAATLRPDYGRRVPGSFFILSASRANGCEPFNSPRTARRWRLAAPETAPCGCGMPTRFVFRNRAGTALKLLVYDGTGCWLCLKRFSQGRLQWWPRAADTPLHPLEAQQLSVLLYNGLPEQARFVAPWRKVDSNAVAHAANAAGSSSDSPRA